MYSVAESRFLGLVADISALRLKCNRTYRSIQNSVIPGVPVDGDENRKFLAGVNQTIYVGKRQYDTMFGVDFMVLPGHSDSMTDAEIDTDKEQRMSEVCEYYLMRCFDCINFYFEFFHDDVLSATDIKKWINDHRRIEKLPWNAPYLFFGDDGYPETTGNIRNLIAHRKKSTLKEGMSDPRINPKSLARMISFSLSSVYAITFDYCKYIGYKFNLQDTHQLCTSPDEESWEKFASMIDSMKTQ